MTPSALTDGQYFQLLQLRTRLRGFLRWSEEQARAQGLTASQHQLLLALRGHPDPLGPTIGEVADYLSLRHHSAVGLVDRAEQAGLVRRRNDPGDARVVRLGLTARGETFLSRISEAHLEELTRLGANLRPLLRGLDVDQDDRGGSRSAIQNQR
jgi:DNA-binding MarR family transcriptional regulator